MSLASVDLAAVRDAGDDDQPRFVVYGIDDAIVADSQPVVVVSGKLDRANRTRVERECVDCSSDACAQWIVEPSVGSRGLSMQPDFEGAGLAGYFLTSAQATVLPTSSRACSAARLSSR